MHQVCVSTTFTHPPWFVLSLGLLGLRPAGDCRPSTGHTAPRLPQHTQLLDFLPFLLPLLHSLGFFVVAFGVLVVAFV